MMQSFRDPTTGVLKAFGFVASNAPGDLAQDEVDDFALEPGKWKLVAGLWVVNEPSFDSLKAIELADFRAKREMFLNRVAGIGFAAQESGDTVTVQAAMSVRQGLLDLPASAPVQAATDLPTLHAAIKAQYAAVVGAVPDSAKAAFAKVDA